MCSDVFTYISAALHHSLCPCAFSVQMLAVDLSILVSGVDLNVLESDSDISRRINHQSVIQWEAELLQERLQEFLHAAADSETQV